MIRLERLKTWVLIAVLTICGTASFASTHTYIPVEGKVAEILERGTILFGTTGDYRPLSFCRPTIERPLYSRRDWRAEKKNA